MKKNKGGRVTPKKEQPCGRGGKCVFTMRTRTKINDVWTAWSGYSCSNCGRKQK